MPVPEEAVYFNTFKPFRVESVGAANVPCVACWVPFVILSFHLVTDPATDTIVLVSAASNHKTQEEIFLGEKFVCWKKRVVKTGIGIVSPGGLFLNG